MENEKSEKRGWSMTFSTSETAPSGKEQTAVMQSCNVALDDEARSRLIPRSLSTTREDMSQRAYIDPVALACMCRQYKASCGVSSLTSVWNALYSIIGRGSLPPVSQEEVMTILGFQPPFEAIKWGPFTGNASLIRWFHRLNQHFGVTGKAYYLWKAHGVGKTIGIAPEEAKAALHAAIRSPSCGVIYHCHNHYMVPLGFVESPRSPLESYAPTLEDPESFVVVGEVSRGKHSPLHTCKWADMVTDITCCSPHFFNIRQPELGLQLRPQCKTPGRNLNGLLMFRCDEREEDVDRFLQEDDEARQQRAAGVLSSGADPVADDDQDSEV